MKIAIVRQRYNAYGGAERFVERALQALSDRAEIEIDLIARDWTGAADAGFHFRRCAPPYFGRTSRDRTFARAVCRMVESGEYDLVQSHERIACCDIFRAGDGLHHEWLKQRSRILSARHRALQSLSPYHRYLLDAEDRLFSGSRVGTVICISRMVQREIVERYAWPIAKLPIIYNGIDLDVYHPDLSSGKAQFRERMGIPNDQCLFLFVGSGFERKGLDIALRALPAGTHLMVVGRDKHQNQYERLCARLGISQRVHFFGGQKDVRSFYGAADAFVFPTLYEPFGNVVLEALACGLPVITTFTCGASELIEQGKNGFICDARDRDGFHAAMTEFAIPGRSEAARKLARDSVMHLSLSAMGTRLAELYRQLLGK